jgi:hypothetical protein
MSSRQIKWLREQLSKRNKRPEQTVEEIDDFDLPTTTQDFSILASPPLVDEPPPVPATESPPLPPPSQRKVKSEPLDEEQELADLLRMGKERRTAAAQQIASVGEIDIQSFNMIRELKSRIGSTKFDECLPKNSKVRFISRLKKWPKYIQNYFQFNEIRKDVFRITLTEFGASHDSIFRAFARENDAESLLTLGQTSHFCPPILPIMCQACLFDREFDSATEIVLRGLYIIQMSLPTNFIPFRSKIIASPGRLEFLRLIQFLCRFAFRRDCFQTCLNLHKFGLSLTSDDPCNFLLTAAVPALYVGDIQFVEKMMEGDRCWRKIPVKFIPDWPIVLALLRYAGTTEFESLAREASRWPFIFEREGMMDDGVEWPEILKSLGLAFRKRIEKWISRPEFEGVMATAAVIGQDMYDDEAICVAMSFWFGVEVGDVDIGDLVEESALPAG